MRRIAGSVLLVTALACGGHSAHAEAKEPNNKAERSKGKAKAGSKAKKRRRAPKADAPGQITIYMSGFRNAKGNAAIALFTSPKGWPEKGQLATFRREARIVKGKAKIVVKNVPPGEFAIALLHDENKNKKMEKNFLGMPQEGFGFSRNPKIKMGAPGWKKVALRLDPGKKVNVKINVKYL
ncbi:MAG: DUF2141 domain-containing protein [Deltaproteobacteria bacterium]|nr:DUF2141 domain-containing protein [Deltaproteobacteria bacterium]